MMVLYRLGFYLAGFSFGLIFLAFFFNGKKTSCNYGLNARVINNLTQKKITLSPTIKEKFSHLNDSIIKKYVINGNVNFSKSDTQRDSCRLYHIDTNNKRIALQIENCKKAAIVVGYQIIN